MVNTAVYNSSRGAYGTPDAHLMPPCQGTRASLECAMHNICNNGWSGGTCARKVWSAMHPRFGQFLT